MANNCDKYGIFRPLVRGCFQGPYRNIDYAIIILSCILFLLIFSFIIYFVCTSFKKRPKYNYVNV